MDESKAKQLFSIMKERFVGAEVTTTSVLIAYYLLLSMVPLLIVVGNILPYFNIDVEVVIGYTRTVLPDMVQPVLEPVVRNLLTSSSGGLLSVGILAAIWSSSKGMGYIQRGVNKAYGLPKASNFIVRRLMSLLIIILILLLLVAFLLVGSLGEAALQTLPESLEWAEGALHSITSLRWPVAILFAFALMVLLYRVAPDVKVRIRDTLPGAALATAGLLVLVQGFTLYLRFSARTYSSYGVLGAFFVMMFWLNFSAMILLLGAVLNASIQEYHLGKPTEQIGRMDNVLEGARQGLLKKVEAWRQRRRKAGKAAPGAPVDADTADTDPPEDE